MTSPAAAVDVESAVAAWLRTELASDSPVPRVVTELPADLTGQVVQVERIGGRVRDLFVDDATVDFACFAATRQDARALALRCHLLVFRTLPGQSLTGGRVTRVQELSGPAYRPYVNTSVRVFGLSAQLTVRPGS